MKLPVLLALALTAPAAAGDVLTVESDGSGDYPDVASAVAAAQDGDIVLIGPGGYSAPDLLDRDLALVARPGPPSALVGRTRVRDQARGKTVLISGLVLRSSSTGGPALEVLRCKGPVRIDGATVIGEDGDFCAGGDALGVRRSRDAAVLRSTARGGWSGLDVGCSPTPTGGRGLVARHATLATWRSLFYGGIGSHAVLPDLPTAGGSGAQLDESTLHAFYGLFEGGNGGNGFGGTPFCGEGGDGIQALASTAWDQSSILVGGKGGTGDNMVTCSDGQGYAGTGHQLVAGPPRGLEGPRVVTAGQPMTLDVYALPGELASLALSEETRFALDLAAEGGRLVGRLDFPLIPLARVDGDGHVAVTLDAPPLLSTEEGRVVYLQLVVQDALAGTTRLGSPIAVVVLQPGV